MELAYTDITFIDRKCKKCSVIDPAYPFDTCIKMKEEEKCTSYSELKYEIARTWKMRKVDVIPVVKGALGTATKQLYVLIMSRTRFRVNSHSIVA